MSGEFHHSVEDVQLTDAKTEEDDYKDSLSCALCNVSVTSSKILQRHLDGRKHRMRTERQGKTFVCELCDVVANSDIQLNIHLNSIKHKNKLTKQDQTEFTTLSWIQGNLWFLLFCTFCIFINLLLVFKVFFN